MPRWLQEYSADTQPLDHQDSRLALLNAKPSRPPVASVLAKKFLDADPFRFAQSTQENRRHVRHQRVLKLVVHSSLARPETTQRQAWHYWPVPLNAAWVIAWQSNPKCFAKKCPSLKWTIATNLCSLQRQCHGFFSASFDTGEFAAHTDAVPAVPLAVSRRPRPDRGKTDNLRSWC